MYSVLRRHTNSACLRVSQRFYRLRPTGTPKLALMESDIVRHSINLKTNFPQISAFIDSYRSHGHRIARINPLATEDKDSVVLPQFDPELYSLKSNDRIKLPVGMLNFESEDDISVAELSNALQDIYCRGIGAEFSYLPPVEREWFIKRMEGRKELYPISQAEYIRSACLMKRSLELNRFIGLKFATVKRYSGEGAEAMLVAVDQALERANGAGVEACVIGMPHRGRNDLLTCLLGHPIEPYLLKMRGESEFPDNVDATGDTFSHFHYAGKVKFGVHEREMDVSLLPNPSHLEAVTPVAAGKARAKMLTFKDGFYNNKDDNSINGDKVLCFMMHGDASLTGQGVVAETAGFANLPNYSVGGSLHMVVNNQLGFTTEASYGSSFDYPTDMIAKGLSIPVLHVNGDDVEEVIRASRIAVDYRQEFRRDIFIDLVCYRRWGHNELDDPSITQPRMYSLIDAMRPLADTFVETFTDKDVRKEIEKDALDWSTKLQETLRKLGNYQRARMTFGGRWAAIGPAPDDHLSIQPTGVSRDRLHGIGLASVEVPEDFRCHPIILRNHIERRRDRMSSDADLDWATAEAMAVGSLMQEGIHCRISGQDVGRGTFSHRHFMLVNQNTDEVHIPLNVSLPRYESRVGSSPGLLEVANSSLSEEGVLSFEYGFSLEDPNRLVIWEAQFGDFFNSAQVPIDCYVTSGETKWQFQSGMVMLLPHGYDGAGPEHSSCRMERFLQITDSRENAQPPDGEDRNFIIVNPTTPAQYFHVLRRQMARPWRKPLVVVAPKLILRSPQATSKLDDMAEGTHFHHILSDPDVLSGRVDKIAVRRVVLCTGKHFYALDNSRKLYEAWDTAIIRIEQLCPFPIVEIARELRQFPNAQLFIWSQEEQRNMGAWSFVRSRIEATTGVKLQYVGRPELATVAVGNSKRHKAEIEKVLAYSFGQSE